MLGEFVESTGYNRVYAARVLRGRGLRVKLKPGVVLEGSARVHIKRPRRPEYGAEVQQVLKKVRGTMDYICGKRLAAVIPKVVPPKLVECGELEVSPEVQEKVLGVSAATIDRLLAEERR